MLLISFCVLFMPKIVFKAIPDSTANLRTNCPIAAVTNISPGPLINSPNPFRIPFPIISPELSLSLLNAPSSTVLILFKTFSNPGPIVNLPNCAPTCWILAIVLFVKVAYV